jgi:hypothetical protein
MRAARQVIRLPSRTMVIPVNGISMSESVKVPIPVETTTAACTAVEPIRRGLLERRDQISEKYRRIQQLGRDTLASRRELERAVGSLDIDTAQVAREAQRIDCGITIEPETSRPCAGLPQGQSFRPPGIDPIFEFLRPYR